MRSNWHSNETNPAFVPAKGGVYRLPGVFNGLAFDGPNYSQLVTKENGQPVIDLNAVIDYLGDENVIRNDFSLQTIGFGFSVKKDFFVSFGHSIKYNAFFKYPKTLAQVIYQGNAQFIGEEVNIGNEMQLSGYHSVDLGLAYKKENLTIGAKAKFMSGFVDVSTDPQHDKVSLYTDPDIYQITLAGDYILNSSNSLDYRAYNDFDFDLNFGTFTADKFFDGNTGWAFDLGVHYKKDKLDLAASVIDLGGKINWKTRVTNYTVQDDYEYEGLDFSDAITGGDAPDFGNTLDTLEQIFDPVRGQNAYSNTVPRKIYLSGMYQVHEKINIGAVFFSEYFRGVERSSFGLHGSFDVAKWLNAGLTYSAKNGTFDNLGMSLVIHGKAFQLFAVSDNLIDLLNPTQGNDFAVRLGGNLFF